MSIIRFVGRCHGIWREYTKVLSMVNVRFQEKKFLTLLMPINTNLEMFTLLLDSHYIEKLIIRSQKVLYHLALFYKIR